MDSLPPETRLALKAYGDEQLDKSATGPLTVNSWAKKPARFRFGNVHLDVGESKIRMFIKTRSDALAAATVMAAPIASFPCPVVYHRELYCIGLKLGVSRDGEMFRASDDDINAALKKIPGLPSGVTAPAWLELVADVYRHHEKRVRSSSKYSKEDLRIIVKYKKHTEERMHIRAMVEKRPAPVATALSLADRVKMRKRTGK